MNVLTCMLFLFVGIGQWPMDFGKKLKENTIYYVNTNVDLKGETVMIPQGCTLIFKNGKISNGKVVFNKTALTGNVLIDADVGGTLTNRVVYSEWFGAKPDSKKDSSLGINRSLNLARATGSTVKLRKGEYILKGHLKLNGVPVGRDTARYLNHNYLTLEGEGGKTVLVNMFKADVINLGYCKNIKVCNLTVINDRSVDAEVRSQRKSGVNLCSIVNAINVEVSGLTLSQGYYYPHTKRESGVEYFDGGKGLTIQGELFDNIYVSDCSVDNCIYGLDVTTSYPFFQNEKSKIRVERVSVRNCYRGCVITGGGNRDESLYHITKNLISLKDIIVKNCFQSVTTQQSVATHASVKVINTQPVIKLIKKPNSEETWLQKNSNSFSEITSCSFVFNASQSIGCYFEVDADIINTNYVLIVQGSYTQAGKKFYHRDSTVKMTINGDYKIVPKIKNEMITDERAVFYRAHTENIKPHLRHCQFTLKGFNGKNNYGSIIPKELLDEVIDSKWILE